MKSYTLCQLLKIDNFSGRLVIGESDESRRYNSLSQEDMEKIKMLFNVALDNILLMYFDGRYVIEPYEGLEFKSLEEEFYYNNSNSYLVFKDEESREVAFKIKYLKGFNFDRVYKVVEKAFLYTKNHPEVSDYKVY